MKMNISIYLLQIKVLTSESLKKRIRTISLRKPSGAPPLKHQVASSSSPNGVVFLPLAPEGGQVREPGEGRRHGRENHRRREAGRGVGGDRFPAGHAVQLSPCAQEHQADSHGDSFGFIQYCCEIVQLLMCSGNQI